MTDNINSAAESQQMEQAQPSEQQPQPSGRMGVIYKITNTLNGKGYVGQTRQKLNRRISGHKNSKVKRGIDAAIDLYGFENFTVEVLEICHVELLNEREIFFIRELNTKVPNGYNLTDGGDNNVNPSDETRAKMSAAKKGKPSPLKGKHLSDETRANISANHADASGENNGFYGKHHTEEARAKMSAAKKGKSHKPHSLETKAKIAAKLKGRPSPAKGKPSPRKGKKCSPETCAKMSAAHKGKKGKPHSEETKAKIAATSTGRKHTAESRAKMSESQKARWARKKLESQNNS